MFKTTIVTIHRFICSFIYSFTDGAEKQQQPKINRTTNVSFTGKYTRYFFYKNHVYKNVEAQKCPFFKNIVVILLVAISISFEPHVEI